MFLILSLSMPLYLSFSFPCLILLPCLILSCSSSCSCYSCSHSCLPICSFAGGVGNLCFECKSLPKIMLYMYVPPRKPCSIFFKEVLCDLGLVFTSLLVLVVILQSSKR